ncbi:RNA-binding rnp24 [Lecanosticta acicola]|uniref:RNA-binding rnp24 n=1 Tax=Lecanosticta acicola TaxID=111012 RepID=A0AAI8W0A2_9PEZI|nr:RNA-binding rnp24 [Lecanosticta acicola]
MSSSSAASAHSKKRKRDIIPENEDEKLEIDVNAPEPASKKAKRKEKKLAKSSSRKVATPKTPEEDTAAKSEGEEDVAPKQKSAPAAETPAKRSAYGIWIGNLPFHATKASVREFLRDEGGIDETSVTRVHMPTGERGQNKGFAYVDFTTPAVLDIALTLSERLLLGRKVLIKNAKSFEGRPQKTAAEIATNGSVSGKAPSKRIFVGNLSFDITQDDLEQHFSQAGQVEDVHVATFEDSGKCKGYAWLTFANVQSAQSAVRGFVHKEAEEDADEEDDGDEVKTRKRPSKPKKPVKWFINRLYGRELRCEFAEDSQTRYKKRFAGGGAKDNRASGPTEDAITAADEMNGTSGQHFTPRSNSRPKLDKDQRQAQRRLKHDARRTAPGKALAHAPRSSAAIVAGAGNKVTFD